MIPLYVPRAEATILITASFIIGLFMGFIFRHIIIKIFKKEAGK